MAERKQQATWRTGFILIVIAVLLYGGSLLGSSEREPLLMLAVLLLLPLGIYLIARGSAVAPQEDPLQVRLNGPGEPGSPQRGAWAHAQLRRGRSIRTAMLLTLIAALALFVENHVTGKIDCEPLQTKGAAAGQAASTQPVSPSTPVSPSPTSPSPAPTSSPSPEASPSPETSPSPSPSPSPAASPSPAPETSPSPEPSPSPSPAASPAPASTPGTTQETQQAVCEDLAWKTHIERWGKGGTYLTQQGDSLASVALLKDIAPAQLGPENPAAVLEATFKSPLANAMGEPTAEGPASPFTIEAIARKLVITPAEVATRFATAPLQAGQNLDIPAEPPYDPRQWFDWLLWALVGVAAYLLIEIARNLRKVPQGEGDFLGETSWYWTQLITGPLIAFVILLLFTHVDFDLLTGEESSTIEVNLRGYPIDLLIVPAFLLGFYCRVTRELLDQITRAIFRGAWRAAYGSFQVMIKGQTDTEISSPVMLQTDPPTVVVWSATAGTVDAGGVYQPPAVTEPTKVFVTAVAPSSGQAATREITVVKHKFEVVSASSGNTLQQGTPLKLDVQPPVAPPDDATIQWEVVEPKGGAGVTLTPMTGNQTQVTADATLAGKTVTIQATYAKLSKKIDLVVV